MCNIFVTAMRARAVKGLLRRRLTIVAGLAMLAMLGGTAHAQQDLSARALNLPTGKQLLTPAPGDPRRTNGLPMSLAVSPDRRWVVSLNAGYGTFESGYMQSLAVLDVSTGEVKDFPDARTLIDAKQTLSGLAFSTDGMKVYASLASSSDPQGDGDRKTGNGIVVYGFAEGVLTPERFLRLPPVTLAAGRHTSLLKSEDRTVSPYPSALAVVPGGAERLLVAENLSDTVAELDTHTGAVARRFDLSVSENVPATYPIALAVTKDGKRAFVALWNVSEVAELDLVEGTVVRHVKLMKPSAATAPGTHPCALLLDERAGVLYAALSNRDAVAAIEIGNSDPVLHRKLNVRGYFDTRLPGQSYFGAEPSALAENEDGSRLYAANLGSDAVAVLDPRRLRRMSPGQGMAEPIGFVPTELMPMALASAGHTLYVATAKGKGTGPNNMAPRPTAATKRMALMARGFTYAPTLLYGSLAALDQAAMESELKASTAVVLESNRMKAARETMRFADGGSPIKHVIYILKENRTYDQVLGDLAKDGKPVGNGDPTLTMYGTAVTPNQHRLALQFGVLDNFFDSGEVSGDGHVWSNAGIGTDYVEKTWQQFYRSEQRTYDYEGMVADGYPLLQHIPDVSEPASGYLWTNFQAHGKTIYHFAEYISSIFCGDKKVAKRAGDPKLGAMSGSEAECASPAIEPGGSIPEEWGGGKNLWPWAIPRRRISTRVCRTRSARMCFFGIWSSGSVIARPAMTRCPTTSSCGCPMTTPKGPRSAAQPPRPRLRTTTWPSAASWRRSRTRRSGMTRPY